MTNKQFESEKEYESRLCIIKSMLKSELITEDEYDKIDKLRGMDIIFVTTASTDEEARELLTLLGMPFRV